MGKGIVFILVFMCYSCEQAPWKTTQDVWNDVCKKQIGKIEYKQTDKNYVLIAGNDNLDDTDVEMLDVGLYCLGETPEIVNTKSTTYELPDYISRDVYFLYFSGHGNVGRIFLEEKPYYLGSYDRITAENVFFSSCMTLSEPDYIRNAISDKVKYVMGYSDKSYSPVDNNVVYKMLKFMQQGKSIPISFYLAASTEAYVDNSWVIYRNDNGVLTEFSARSGVNFTE